jgi:hypothetical protein
VKEDDMNEAVACSLRPGDFGQRIEAWHELLGSRLLTRESTHDGCVLTLSATPGVAAVARGLADQEATCCPWMNVQITDGDVVTIRFSSSSQGGPETIRELFQTV